MTTRFGQYGLIGGSVAAGVLQLANGVALDTTLRAVTDQAGNASPLQLSTTQVAFDVGGTNALIYRTADGLLQFKGALNIESQSSSGIVNIAAGSGSGFVRINTPTGLYVGTGAITPTARLHVRGDGTNPIVRFDNSAGVSRFNLTDAGLATFADSIAIGGAGFLYANNFQSTNFNAPITFNGFTNFTLNPNTSNATSGTINSFTQTSLFSAAAGSANYRAASFNYTINNSGTQGGTATGIFLNATETALNGMTHNLMDLQLGGTSRFRVDRVGAFSCGNTVAVAAAIASTHKVTIVIGGVTYFLLASNV